MHKRPFQRHSRRTSMLGTETLVPSRQGATYVLKFHSEFADLLVLLGKAGHSNLMPNPSFTVLEFVMFYLRFRRCLFLSKALGSSLDAGCKCPHQAESGPSNRRDVPLPADIKGPFLVLTNFHGHTEHGHKWFALRFTGVGFGPPNVGWLRLLLASTEATQWLPPGLVLLPTRHLHKQSPCWVSSSQ